MALTQNIRVTLTRSCQAMSRNPRYSLASTPACVVPFRIQNEEIIDAIVSKPVEVVFPAVAGRFQRIVGALPQLMHWAIPWVEAAGRRKRARLIRTHP